MYLRPFSAFHRYCWEVGMQFIFNLLSSHFENLLCNHNYNSWCNFHLKIVFINVNRTFGQLVCRFDSIGLYHIPTNLALHLFSSFFSRENKVYDFPNWIVIFMNDSVSQLYYIRLWLCKCVWLHLYQKFYRKTKQNKTEKIVQFSVWLLWHINKTKFKSQNTHAINFNSCELRKHNHVRITRPDQCTVRSNVCVCACV